MQIIPVPVRSDNYAYLILSKGKAAFVDPFDIDTVTKAAKEHGIEDKDVVGLLTTHHHADHSGGNQAFSQRFPSLPIYGGSRQIPALTQQVKHDDVISILPDIQARCLATPCHTQDHICYYIQHEGQRAVFTGDTLFVSGCGRFFEGDATQMHSALNKVLASLPDDTKVYCGHEYTPSNAEFSAKVLPDDPAVQKLIKDLETKKVTTGVYTIGDEKKHNVFMRVHDPKVQRAVGGKDEVDTMHKLREAKNSGTLPSANI